MLESKVNQNSLVVNEQLNNIQFPLNCNLVAIFRNSDVIIPRGDDRLLANDRIIMIMSTSNSLKEVEMLFGNREGKVREEGVRNIMIYGATRTGIHLAKLLEQNTEITLIEELRNKIYGSL